jgi:PPOX class probable F420-dependent enzyme
MTATREGDRREYEELLTEYHTAILTTRGADGHLHARPMAVQEERRAGGELWFATSRDTAKVAEIEADPHVGLSFHSSERDAAYLSISGTAEIVTSRRLIHELWSPGWKAWFPEGPDQEDLVLVKVTPEHVEWMKPEGGKARVLFTMAKQALTGRRDQVDEKRTLDLQ